MDRLDAMRLFVRVVERGSFSAAAREAGIGQSAVSKQIAALEAHLGAQLMRRTSRRMTLTDAGQILSMKRRCVWLRNSTRRSLWSAAASPRHLAWFG